MRQTGAKGGGNLGFPAWHAWKGGRKGVHEEKKKKPEEEGEQYKPSDATVSEKNGKIQE